MPRVIGQDHSVAKRITCKRCGAINEYLPNEVRILHQGRDIDGSYSETKGFECAACCSEIFTSSY